MFDVIKLCAQTAVGHLTAEINTSVNCKHGPTINIPDWAGRVTLDVLGRFAFGYDFECGESKAAKIIQQSWKKQVDLSLQTTGFIVIGVINLRGDGVTETLMMLRAFPIIADLPIPAIQAQGLGGQVSCSGHRQVSYRTGFNGGQGKGPVVHARYFPTIS
jgi:hypothetical protein